MARLKLAFVAFALVVIAAWLLSIDVSLLSGNFWSVRGLVVLLTGILAIAFMSAAILLAAKPVQIEEALGGLDKFLSFAQMARYRRRDYRGPPLVVGEGPKMARSIRLA
jgi:predicted ferric reductase